jgi:hypothetical protein
MTLPEKMAVTWWLHIALRVLENVTTANEEHYKVNDIYTPYLLGNLQNIL